MKSIMHSKQEGTCYLCMMLHSDYSQKQTQEHHVIFGTANRKLSERYGLKIYLCMAHHEEGKEAVHKNAEIAIKTKKEAQRKFEQKWPELSFREVFGKNYLDELDRQQDQPKETEKGFILLEQRGENENDRKKFS